MSDVYGFAESIEQMESELGETFSFAGTEYKCIAGARNDVRDLGVGGYSTGAEVEIVVRKALFTTPPRSQDVITYRGRGMLIISALESPDGACLVLSCDDQNKYV